ncbi:hypothetical protein GCM10027073_73280 [Streptomyces chlorus]
MRVRPAAAGAGTGADPDCGTGGGNAGGAAVDGAAPARMPRDATAGGVPPSPASALHDDGTLAPADSAFTASPASPAGPPPPPARPPRSPPFTPGPHRPLQLPPTTGLDPVGVAL